jgi:5-(carboxyamino)imidazole ribonucleotide synthase
MNMANKTLWPGSRIGVLGGGQLGRMLAQVAHRMGYHVSMFSSESDSPATQVTSHSIVRSLEDPQAIEQFANTVDVITLEFENIPLVAIQRAATITPVRPGELVLATSQNRILEKSTLQSAGFPVTPFHRVDSADDLQAAALKLGWDLILKTANWGYDGKGQRSVHNEAEGLEALARLGPTNLIAEQRMSFSDEVSILVARSLTGEIKVFPLIHNTHVRHILDVSVCPVPERLKSIESQASDLAKGISEHLGLIGLLCVEFFVVDGALMINEIAPRPHNSGHLTMEACHTGQFEQQLRAITGLPLGDTSLRSSGAMVNLMGDIWSSGRPDWNQAIGQRDAFLHLYGKAEPRAGRKMGHLTVMADSPEAAVQQALKIRKSMIRSPAELFPTME